MGLKERFGALKQQLGFGAQNDTVDADGGRTVTTNTGEHRGYRPGSGTAKQAPVKAQPSEPVQPQQYAQYARPQESVQQPAQPEVVQPGFADVPAGNSQPMYSGTPGEGFTAQMPWHQGQQAQTGYQPVQQTQQPVTGYQPVQQTQQPVTGYQPVQQAQQPVTGYQPVQQAQQPVTGYSPVQQAVQPSIHDRFMQSDAGQAQAQGVQWGNGRGDASFNYSQRIGKINRRRRSTRMQEQTGYQTGYQPVQGNAQPVADNVSYMNPNHFVDNGTAYTMVMRLAQPVSTARCYRLIEFMRNGEAVLVNTELITDQAEADRCLDLLFGAAYAMNCIFTRVAARSLYLITPRSVEVLPYAAMEGLAQRDAAARWPGADPSNPQDPAFRRFAQQPQYAQPQMTGYQAGQQVQYAQQPQYSQQQPAQAVGGWNGMNFF